MTSYSEKASSSETTLWHHITTPSGYFSCTIGNRVFESFQVFHLGNKSFVVLSKLIFWSSAETWFNINFSLAMASLSIIHLHSCKTHLGPTTTAGSLFLKKTEANLASVSNPWVFFNSDWDKANEESSVIKIYLHQTSLMMQGNILLVVKSPAPRSVGQNTRRMIFNKQPSTLFLSAFSPRPTRNEDSSPNTLLLSQEPSQDQSFLTAST